MRGAVMAVVTRGICFVSGKHQAVTQTALGYGSAEQAMVVSAIASPAKKVQGLKRRERTYAKNTAKLLMNQVI